MHRSIPSTVDRSTRDSTVYADAPCMCHVGWVVWYNRYTRNIRDGISVFINCLLIFNLIYFCLLPWPLCHLVLGRLHNGLLLDVCSLHSDRDRLVRVCAGNKYICLFVCWLLLKDVFFYKSATVFINAFCCVPTVIRWHFLMIHCSLRSFQNLFVACPWRSLFSDVFVKVTQ